MDTFGKTLVVLSQIVGAVAYIGTAAWFFLNDKAGLGILAVLVPPADLILMFLTPWWPVGLAAIALLLVGSLSLSAGSRS